MCCQLLLSHWGPDTNMICIYTQCMVAQVTGITPQVYKSNLCVASIYEFWPLHEPVQRIVHLVPQNSNHFLDDADARSTSAFLPTCYFHSVPRLTWISLSAFSTLSLRFPIPGVRCQVTSLESIHLHCTSLPFLGFHTQFEWPPL